MDRLVTDKLSFFGHFHFEGPMARSVTITVAFIALLLFAVYLSILQVRLIGCATPSSNDFETSLAHPARKESSTAPASSDTTSYIKPPLFNPWRDFQFNKLTNGTTVYSSHTCVAAARYERRADHISRTCWYQNLYYHVKTKTFHYYPNPSEKAVLSTEKSQIEEMDTSLWHVRESTTSNFSLETHGAPWRPVVHVAPEDEVPTDVTLASTNNGRRPILVLYRGSMGNYGHMIWDDFLSIYMQLDLFDLHTDDDLFPIPFVEDPKTYLGGSYCLSYNPPTWSGCVKFYKRLYPSLWNVDTDCSGDVVRTGNWLQGTNAIGKWKGRKREKCGDYRDGITNTVDSEYVLVPNVTVGAGRLAHFSCYGECTLGRASNLFHFRNYLMRRMLGYDHATNPKGYITFSIALGASRGAGEVTYFEEEIKRAKEKYGEDAVKAVDFASLSAQEQGLLIGNSAALFTNHGGGSASTVFLPKGASAFVYWRGFQRDEEFYRSVSYFRTQWIEYKARRHLDRTMRLLEMELRKTAIHYPDMICFRNTRQQE